MEQYRIKIVKQTTLPFLLSQCIQEKSFSDLRNHLIENNINKLWILGTYHFSHYYDQLPKRLGEDISFSNQFLKSLNSDTIGKLNTELNFFVATLGNCNQRNLINFKNSWISINWLGREGNYKTLEFNGDVKFRIVYSYNHIFIEYCAGTKDACFLLGFLYWLMNKEEMI